MTAARGMSRPAVHQVLATLGYGDAIGHEVLGIQRVLARAGFHSEIIVETADPRLEDLTVDYRDMVKETGADDLLIHHFSIGSRASRTAFALPCRMMLVYHNITPPEYFLGVHEQLVRQCFYGRRELLPYRSRCELAVGDSEFNRQELAALGFPRTAVLPVVPDFSHLDVTPDTRVLDAYDDDWTNLLFVGRLIPNKRPDNLIRIAHAYQSMYNRRTRLLLAGSHGGFETYLAQLHTLTSTLGATDIEILGHVTNEELTALYDVADVFVSASEHEGFSVPPIEAFYKGVPVVALAATAVPDTMDGGGILYDRANPGQIAGIVHRLLSNPALEAEVLAKQDAALARLKAKDFEGLVLGFVNQALEMPRQSAPAVAPDFWHQFALAEKLEAIRQVRPSAFKALPLAPDAGHVSDLGHRA
jgi:glycosyltransferase involved in cell wall biosynthesis